MDIEMFTEEHKTKRMAAAITILEEYSVIVICIVFDIY